MKITTDKVNLVNGLAKVQNAISARNSLPVLNHILLEASAGILNITATDLELSISTKIHVDIEIEGVVTLPAKKLFQIIRELPQDKVTIEINDKFSADIRCAKSYFKILGTDASEFPKEDDIEGVREFHFSGQKLKKMLDKISYSTSTDETRLVLNGILFSIREETFSTVATDGRRLAMVETIIDTEESVDGDAILPAKAISELQKVLGEEGDVTIQFGDARAIFKIDNTILKTKLIEGTYPNYKQVIPSGFTKEININRHDYFHAIQRVSLILPDSSSSIKCLFKDGQVEVSSNSETDESNEPVETDYNGEEMSISFNPLFLCDPLKKLEIDTITLKFNDTVSPIGMFGDEGFLYVIMPMRN